MSEPDFLSSSRIAIVGLGLMGGSLALALRDRCRALMGCDLDPQTRSLARKLNLVDQVTANPAVVLLNADVVILATPLNAILRIIAELPNLHPGSAIVLDLGSTKAQVVQALESLPPRFDTLGGHPMCGKEIAGLENADPEIYQGATFAFTALQRTSSKARLFAEQLAQRIGSQTLWIDPDTHDQWSAATSHLPYLVAAALSTATPSQCAPLVGPGFRSTTRLAATPASIMLDVLSTNRANILESLNRFRRELDYLEEKLSGEESHALNMALNKSAEHQRALVANRLQREAR
jgi:prephenate dehydrogenase